MDEKIDQSSSGTKKWMYFVSCTILLLSFFLATVSLNLKLGWVGVSSLPSSFGFYNTLLPIVFWSTFSFSYYSRWFRKMRAPKWPTFLWCGISLGLLVLVGVSTFLPGEKGFGYLVIPIFAGILLVITILSTILFWLFAETFLKNRWGKIIQFIVFLMPFLLLSAGVIFNLQNIICNPDNFLCQTQFSQKESSAYCADQYPPSDFRDFDECTINNAIKNKNVNYCEDVKGGYTFSGYPSRSVNTKEGLITSCRRAVAFTVEKGNSEKFNFSFLVPYSFESCAAAGNIIYDNNPRKCKTSEGDIFEETGRNYRGVDIEGIELEWPQGEINGDPGIYATYNKSPDSKYPAFLGSIDFIKGSNSNYCEDKKFIGYDGCLLYELGILNCPTEDQDKCFKERASYLGFIVLNKSDTQVYFGYGATRYMIDSGKLIYTFTTFLHDKKLYEFIDHVNLPDEYEQFNRKNPFTELFTSLKFVK